MDVFSKKKRSAVMSRIRSKDTKCEIALRKSLSRAGIRGYRKNRRVLGFGTDIVFSRKKVAVFCDSDFWHGRKAKIPANNRGYWERKLERNRERDAAANRALKKGGWKVLRISEKSILKDPERESVKVIKALGGRA